MATQASKIRTCSDLRAYFCGQGCELFTAVEDIHQPFDISGINSWLEGQQSSSETLINFCLCIVTFFKPAQEKNPNMGNAGCIEILSARMYKNGIWF